MVRRTTLQFYCINKKHTSIIYYYNFGIYQLIYNLI